MITNYKISNPFNEKQVMIYDIEVYPNYFLATFLNVNKVNTFEISQLEELKEYLNDNNKVLIGYNSINYDEIILKAIVNSSDITEEKIYKLSNCIINRTDTKNINQLKWYIKSPWVSIDLMQLSFLDDGGFAKSSLKEIATRMNWKKIQDLPYDPETILTDVEKDVVKNYCQNDVMITLELWNRLADEVKLRLELEKLYSVEVISSSRPQCAEEILKQLYSRKSGLDIRLIRNLKTDIKEIYLRDLIPSWIKFKTLELQKFLDKLKYDILPIKIIRENETIRKYVDGSSIKQIINIGGKNYAFGLGGFHSEDRADIFISDELHSIVDIDATSYYPFIILRMGLYPSHLTFIWNQNYKEVTEERIKAKKIGETLKAEAMKILINSSFGKTGNMYSFMYDPRMMAAVTIVGQLSMMMFIEQMELSNIQVLSVNTDGVTCLVRNDKKPEFDEIRNEWEQVTKFQLEEKVYLKYIRKDINNYIAEYLDGKIKRKGVFDYGSLYKKNDSNIIAIALEKYFINSIPVEKTIREHDNIYDFLYSFKANKGYKVYSNHTEVQRINRWYISKNSGIEMKKIRLSDNQEIKIANASSVKIVNDIEDEAIPDDLDIAHYIVQAKKIIFAIENREKAEGIRQLGFYPIPKEFKKNPSGSKMSKIQEDWNWGKYSGCACYTGPEAGIIGIDIDHPEICKIFNLFKDTLTAWHGNGNRRDVIVGKKRGTLLYRCKNEAIYPTKKDFNNKYGFEVIYGNNSIQLTGFHQNGEEYHYDGQIVDLPVELESWIKCHLPRRRKSKKQMQENEDCFYSEDDKETLQNVISLLLPDWEYTENI